MSVLSHINDALSHLRDAREEAGIGTGLMLDEAIDNIETIRNRYKRINNVDDER